MRNMIAGLYPYIAGLFILIFAFWGISITAEDFRAKDSIEIKDEVNSKYVYLGGRGQIEYVYDANSDICYAIFQYRQKYGITTVPYEKVKERAFIVNKK